MSICLTVALSVLRAVGATRNTVTTKAHKSFASCVCRHIWQGHHHYLYCLPIVMDIKCWLGTNTGSIMRHGCKILVYAVQNSQFHCRDILWDHSRLMKEFDLGNNNAVFCTCFTGPKMMYRGFIFLTIVPYQYGTLSYYPKCIAPNAKYLHFCWEGPFRG
jgi:hypothetical protein